MRGRAGPGAVWPGPGRQETELRAARGEASTEESRGFLCVTCQANYFPITGPHALSPHCHLHHNKHQTPALSVTTAPLQQP